MRPVLAADFDNIDEAGGGQQGGTCAAAFKQSVGGDGRTVHELGVNGSVRGGHDAEVCQAGQDGAALVLGRRRLFVHLKTAILQKDEVGKCSTNIDSNQCRGHLERS